MEISEKKMYPLKNKKRVLIHYKGALGDTICLTACLAEFKLRNPDSSIVVHTSYPDVFVNNPYVDDIIRESRWTTVNGRFGSLRKVPVVYECLKNSKKLLLHRKNMADQVYDIKTEFMYENRARYHLTDTIALQLGLTEKPRTPQIYLTDEERVQIDGQFDLPEGPLVAISVHVGWESRQWPVDRFRNVARYLNDKGYQVLQMGGSQHGAIEGMGYDLVGKTNVRQAARILELCELLVGIDNGLYHLAAAVGTPAVVMFGPVCASLRMHPVKAEGLEPVSQCKGCSHRIDLGEYPNRRCPIGTTECMNSISVDDVIQSSERLLNVQ
ncbi:MAG: glycosyltransferase family 9 protein [Anaerohalosphaera sp.]|nr:glycosyltransferase family 9 protein [Anaerohalosphaera sp.]